MGPSAEPQYLNELRALMKLGDRPPENALRIKMATRILLVSTLLGRRPTLCQRRKRTVAKTTQPPTENATRAREGRTWGSPASVTGLTYGRPRKSLGAHLRSPKQHDRRLIANHGFLKQISNFVKRGRAVDFISGSVNPASGRQHRRSET